MKSKFLISTPIAGVASLFIAGVCLAQAPVVDANQSVINSTELAQRLATLERIVDSRSESQQRMQSQIDSLQNDIDEMRGSIELHNHQLEKLLERQRELYLELDKRFESMQQSSSTLANDIANIDSANPVPVAVNPAGEQSAYQAAVDLILKDKDYVNAVPAFQAFLSQYPNSALTDNAHYWLGQLLYNQQNYAEAKVQFEQVATKFASSPKRADSLLKLGVIEKSIGNLSAANNYFQQVVDEYPESTSAREASRQLAN